MNRLILPVSLFLISLSMAAPVRAGGCCRRCDCCGCECECERVCRAIVGTKTVLKVSYTVECEEFCIPGPSKCCGSHWECDGNASAGCTQRHRVFDWIPNSCGKICTKRKLVKIETPTQVPSYQWVVEHVCPKCAASRSSSRSAPESGEPPVANTPNQDPAATVEASKVESGKTVPTSALAPADSLDDPGTPAAPAATTPASPGLYVKSKLLELLGK